MRGELLSETVNVLVYNILLVLLAIIFCIVVTKKFMDISGSHGFKEKYPIFYNVFIIIFAILLFILSLILISFLFKLYCYLIHEVTKIIGEFILKIFDYNQGGSNQPYGGGQPSGGNQPSGGGGPGGGPSWPQTPQDKRRSCGQDSYGLTDKGGVKLS